MLTHEHPCSSGVIEVDVREQQVADVTQLEATLREAGPERRDAARRAAVEERRAVVRVEQVAGDDARRLMVEVDRRRGHATILGGQRAGRADELDAERLAEGTPTGPTRWSER